MGTELAVTTRTGISRFTFPRTRQANVLFKVAGSANPVSDSGVHLVGRNGIAGQVTSGQFCGTGTNYTLYFYAMFSRPFAATGTWSGSTVSPGVTSCRSRACGAFVTFDTEQDPVVTMKVGISFVSVANAADNLRVEDPGWSLGHVESQATGQWNRILGRIRVGGGSAAQMRTFYTALYHSLLAPDVVSDVNGQYTGSDGMVHASTGRAQYANFSEWDIYRSQIELVSLLAPHQAGDMVQSLVNDAEQGGWLPKWAIVAGDASQMNGDSADPIIAAAYAFGVRDFDVGAALAAMVKGATQTESGHGLEIERQYLDQYLAQHYVDAGSLDLTSSNYSIGGSVTLEYAIDDFSIAQMALAQGDHSLYESMMQRAHNWQYLFNPATGYVQARNPNGSFPAGAAFQSSMLEPGGELGFEEGNAIQYTWSVPQDLAALSDLMGGDAQAVKKLDAFLTVLNAGRDRPFDWAGNEPSLWTPWEYDYFGAPSQAQGAVRKIADSLYSDTPANEPGNDDLGALSSWYVWAAIGLYPVTPGSADLALASPLFPAVSVTLPDARMLVLHAPSASASTPYIHSLSLAGAPLARATPTCASGVGAAPDRVDHLEPTLAAVVDHHHRRDLDLRALVDPRSPMGFRSCAEPSVVRGRPAARRRVLAPERRYRGPGGPGQDGHPRSRSGRGRIHGRVLDGERELRRTGGVPGRGIVQGRQFAPGDGGRRARRLHRARASDPGTHHSGHRSRGPMSSTSICGPPDGTALPPVVLAVHVTA